MYLDIWSYYCGPCRAEAPYAQQLKAAYKNADIEFINIVTDTGKDLKPWSDYYAVSLTKANHYRFKKGFDAELLSAFKVKSVPQYIIIDQNGLLIEYNAPRPSDGDKIKPLFDKLLGAAK